MADHPVKLPPEVFTELLNEAILRRDELNAQPGTVAAMAADRAAQWGADQELEACVEWISAQDWTWTSAQLRAARRPKPPTLAEQGLKAISKGCLPSNDELAIIRTALNRLAELEAQQ